MARVTVASCLVLTPILTFTTISQLANDPPAAVGGAEAALGAPGRAEASAAVVDWLADENSPLPRASLLGWQRSEEVAWRESDKGSAGDLPAFTLYRHAFSVMSPEGDLFVVEVLVAASDSLGVQVMGLPSLLPVAPSAASVAPEVRWPGWVTTNAGQAVHDAVDQWVDAFMSGDGARLRLAVGDPDAKHAYVTFSGVSDSAAELGAVAKPGPGTAVPATDALIVHVTVRFTRDGTLSSAGSHASSFDLDVLVSDSSTAAPRVVAWSGPGSGHLLTPFQNAVSDERSGSVTLGVAEADVEGIVPGGAASSPSPSRAASTPTPSMPAGWND